ncbi:MAG TPA: cytochrome c3 family protein [Polyangiaceae bacterium]|nr:cytochrome c3 family protein [Polyangiaceae bacterium]
MQLFRRSLNKLPLALLVGLASLTAAGTAGSWYYFSPKNLQVGYAPKQPIPYSHKLHVDELGLDCRYCHANVERSQEAMIPSTQTCMGCHAVVKSESPKLAALRDSWKSGDPVPWIRVHKLPEHAYFDHSAHLGAGVGCVTCHGRVDQMQVVRLEAPLAMGWCLECHRDPAPRLRPRSELTNMTWKRDATSTVLATATVAPAGVRAPEHCSGCHR